MQDFISIDFETRSTVDLRKTGVYPYAEHETTDVWCMAYALNDEPPEVWIPGDEVPGAIRAAIDYGYELRAWNANFERIIWQQILEPRYGFPHVYFDRWVDTAAEAAAMSLPRALGQAARVVGIKEQKDVKGHRLMMQMAKPRKRDPLTWWDDSERFRRLIQYCKQDVETEREMARYLRRLPDREREIYLLDQRINDRGVMIDTELVEALEGLAGEAVERANLQLQALTDGKVEAITKVQDVRAWLNSQDLWLDDLTKQTVAETLTKLKDGVAREVLQLRADAGKTSTAKLTAMDHARSDIDGRARGLLLYHGANTGRWSGKLIQPQNFPRPPKGFDIEQYLDRVLEGDYEGLELETPVMALVSNSLRSCFQSAPGHRYMCADFSAIEGHVTAWLAGQGDMMSYEEMAAVIYGCEASEIEEDSEERFVGKTIVLGGGFGMGGRKYQSQLKALTGIEISRKLSDRVVRTYREENHRIVRLWRELEHAAVRAVKEPGQVTTAGRNNGVRYVKRGPYLWCVLPSGRPLAYPNPKIEQYVWGSLEDGTKCKRNVRDMGHGFHQDSDPEDAVEVNVMDKGKWIRRSLYGGLQTENVVQAIARDLMADAMLRVEAAGYPIVLTVHDEVLAEVPDNRGSLEEFCSLMEERPDWGTNIPVVVKGWEGDRYRK